MVFGGGSELRAALGRSGADVCNLTACGGRALPLSNMTLLFAHATFSAPDPRGAAAEIGHRGLHPRSMRAGESQPNEGPLPVFEPETVSTLAATPRSTDG
jgi:hypothetical protein